MYYGCANLQAALKLKMFFLTKMIHFIVKYSLINPVMNIVLAHSPGCSSWYLLKSHSILEKESYKKPCDEHNECLDTFRTMRDYST